MGYIQAVTKSPAKMVAPACLESHTSSCLRITFFKKNDNTQLSNKQEFKCRNAAVTKDSTLNLQEFLDLFTLCDNLSCCTVTAFFKIVYTTKASFYLFLTVQNFSICSSHNRHKEVALHSGPMNANHCVSILRHD